MCQVRLAVMQPYLFPYLGYFQLVRAVDKFVLYDDVSFIKRGWINRNKLLISGGEKRFTLPVKNGNRDVPINEVVVAENYYQWREKFRTMVRLNYSKAVNFEEVYSLIDDWLDLESTVISEINFEVLRGCCNWLGLRTELIGSSTRYANRDIGRAERLLDICQQESVGCYVNPIGGSELYDRQWFASRGVQLKFLEPQLSPYPQSGVAFVPGLSVLDFMMHVPQDQALSYLGEGKLL